MISKLSKSIYNHFFRLKSEKKASINIYITTTTTTTTSAAATTKAKIYFRNRPQRNNNYIKMQTTTTTTNSHGSVMLRYSQKWGIVAEKNPNGQKWVLYARHIFPFYPREIYKHVVKVANWPTYTLRRNFFVCCEIYLDCITYKSGNSSLWISSFKGKRFE